MKQNPHARSRATPMWPWVELRAAAAEDLASAPDLSSGYDLVTVLADVTLGSKVINLEDIFGNGWTTLILALQMCTDGTNDPADNDDFDFDLLGYAKQGSIHNPPILICNTTTDGCSCGTLSGTSIAVYGSTTDYWVSTITLNHSDSICAPEVFDSGSDRIAMIYLDGAGLTSILPLIHGADGDTAGEAPAVSILGRVL